MWKQRHAALFAGFSRGTHRYSAAGHNIHRENPKAVADAIRSIAALLVSETEGPAFPGPRCDAMNQSCSVAGSMAGAGRPSAAISSYTLCDTGMPHLRKNPLRSLPDTWQDLSMK